MKTVFIMIQMPLLDDEDGFTLCCLNCRSWTNWRRNGLGNRRAYKLACTIFFLMYAGWYFSMVMGSPVLVICGGIFVVKIQIETWGQETPTWVVPSSPMLFVVVYGLGIPSIVYLFGGCRNQDIDFRFREALGLVSYLFGSCYSLGYELHRFWWKSKPENKGKLHTTGLASFCIHPNYLGDIFTYGGWALASGTLCALSIVPAQIGYLQLFICPNSDAYLASRYSSEFPAYAATTATLIPGLRSTGIVMKILAWICLGFSFWMQAKCSSACGL